MYCNFFVKLYRFYNEMCFFEERSSSGVVYFRFSGTLFPVSMIYGDGFIIKKTWRASCVHGVKKYKKYAIV